MSSIENVPDEVVAVLTAAIASKQGINANDVKIKRIRKLNNNINFEDNPDELIAVIAAAIQVGLGLDIPDIRIKTIKRAPQNSNAWASMGRMEQLLGKLN